MTPLENLLNLATQVENHLLGPVYFQRALLAHSVYCAYDQAVCYPY